MTNGSEIPIASPQAAEIAGYREFSVHDLLHSYCLCTWTQTIGPGDLPCAVNVLPDGCFDIIWIGEAPPVVAGPATVRQVVTLPPGARVIGVRFRPGTARAVLGIDAMELSDATVPLDALWGAAARSITGPTHDLPSVADRLARIERCLLARHPTMAKTEGAIQEAISILSRGYGASVEEVARQLNVSARHLHRRFSRAVGYSPKRFQRIVRFQRLLALARRSPATVALSELALDGGYADQSHMAREVRELSGAVPSDLLGRFDSTLVMSDLFKTPSYPAR